MRKKKKWDNNNDLFGSVKKVRCKCSHVLCFLTNHSAICEHCGRVVYPSKESEFKEKMELKLRKELKK